MQDTGTARAPRSAQRGVSAGAGRGMAGHWQGRAGRRQDEAGPGAHVGQGSLAGLGSLRARRGGAGQPGQAGEAGRGEVGRAGRGRTGKGGAGRLTRLKRLVKSNVFEFRAGAPTNSARAGVLRYDSIYSDVTDWEN